MMESISTVDRRPIADHFPGASAEAVDFLLRCLSFNPSKRLTAKEALGHPYLAQFHSPDTEPCCSHALKIAVDDNIKCVVFCSHQPALLCFCSSC